MFCLLLYQWLLYSSQQVALLSRGRAGTNPGEVKNIKERLDELHGNCDNVGDLSGREKFS